MIITFTYSCYFPNAWNHNQSNTFSQSGTDWGSVELPDAAPMRGGPWAMIAPCSKKHTATGSLGGPISS